MGKVDVNYFHLADAASVDSGGKVNVLGIFDTIGLHKVPGSFHKFTIVANLNLNQVKKKENIFEIKIFDPKNIQLILKPPIELKFSSNKKRGGMNLILDLQNIKFSSFGKHTIKLYLNNKLIYEKIFEVKERRK